MDDLVARCKHQLGRFRIRELKDVLARLGLPKQGKKQVLMDKILGVFISQERQHDATLGFKAEKRFTPTHVITREEVARAIDDIYRKLRTSGAVDLASAGKNDPASLCSPLSDDEDEATTWDKANICCPCGTHEQKSTLLQCRCGISQHTDCVMFLDKLAENATLHLPNPFYCEICRINHGDPFCVTLRQPLLPTKLNKSLQQVESSNPLQNIETTFTLTQRDRELLHRPNNDLQVWCVLLNDKVPFRIHWPAYIDLCVNGISVHVCNRPGTQLLGLNGRDDGPGISIYTRVGTNRISLSARDARPFCIGVRIIRRCTVQQILSLIPSVTEGELIEEALARVQRCFNGGSCQNADEDDDNSDVEVVAECVTVNLRCPIGGSRIKIAGRFKPCVHMGCFDLKTFLELNQRAHKWQCPICLKNYTLEDLIIDALFSRVTVMLTTYGEDITEVEIKEGGIWRPKLEGEARFHEPWRLLDGSVFLGEKGHRSKEQDSSLTLVKKEEQCPEHLKTSKVGLKRSCDQIIKATKISKFVSPCTSQKMVNEIAISENFSATDSNDDTTLDGDGTIQETCTKSLNTYIFEHPPTLPRLSEPARAPQTQNGSVVAGNEEVTLVLVGDTEVFHWTRPTQQPSASILQQVDPNRRLNLGTSSGGFPVDCNTCPRRHDVSFNGAAVPGQISSLTEMVGNPVSIALESQLMADAEATVPALFSGVIYDFFNNNAANISDPISISHTSDCEYSEQASLSPQQHSASVINLSEGLRSVSTVSEALNPSEFPQTYAYHGYQEAEEHVTYSPLLEMPLQFLFPSPPEEVIVESNAHSGNLLSEEIDSGWVSLSLGFGSSNRYLP